jgi:raffinose/stachyose/melibiose transport system substrate-binding protein
MWMGGSWDIPFFEHEIRGEEAFQWSVFAVPPPAGQHRYVTVHPDIAIGLNAASAHKTEARQFLAWLATPQVAALLGRELPGYLSMHEAAGAPPNEHAAAFYALSQDCETDVRWAWPRLRDGLPNGYDLMVKGTQGVLVGEITPQQAADLLQGGLGQWFEPAQSCRGWTALSRP